MDCRITVAQVPARGGCSDHTEGCGHRTLACRTIRSVLRFFALLAAVLLAMPLAASDLTVGWISRLPEIDYVWNSAHPEREGWPEVGQVVTWRGNVRNWFEREIAVGYEWRLDGLSIASGTALLAPSGISAIDLELPWSFDRQRLSLAIDVSHTVAEESETNNELEVFTDALSLGLWVEQSMSDWFRAHQRELGIGSSSFENWAQRHVALFNDMAAMAVYDETPHGVRDRLRIQKIVIVPDGALPLVPPPHAGEMDGQPNGMTHPDMSDRTVDLQIGLRASTLRSYRDTTTAGPRNPFYLQPLLLHELGHARYLTDVYAFDVRHDPPRTVVEVEGVETGAAAFRTPELGLMNRQFTFIDRYSAIALNRIAGRRATTGNYNDPENIGSFLNDLPAQNRITIRDASGAPLPHARVEIYRSRTHGASEWYAAHYDDVPDLVLQTDANGQVLAGHNPFADGPVMHYWRGTNAVAIVKVEHEGTERIGFLEARSFNLAFWRGETTFADHELTVGAVCGDDAPTLLSPAWDAVFETPEVTLRWSRAPGAHAYAVFVARPGEAPRLAATTAATEVTVALDGRTYWWVEARFSHCPSARSEPSRVEVRLPRRRAARR